MKIQEIEFENFRNFKDHGSILCSTDGKVTIIYGKNGEGKTTLQQLCQWIFYGEVNFNRTTTDKLYNLAYEDTLGYGDVFKVMGRIHFTHMGTNYMLTREANYKKGLTDSAKMNEELSLLKEDNDHNWISVPKAEEVIEMLLPSGLKEYFFFDGESMIADLRVKGRDSANKLRKALYSMFDLDDYERASEHIGDTSKKTTVLGRLYLEKAGAHPTGNIGAIKTMIEKAQQHIQSDEEQKGKKEEIKKEKERFIKESSERIGKALSQEQYEQQRKAQAQMRDGFLSSIKNEQSYFGRDMEEVFPKYLLAKRIMDAKEKLRLKVDREKLTPGVSKPLIDYLISPQNKEKTCICGRPIGLYEQQRLSRYLNMLPPLSYKETYDQFAQKVMQWGANYDRDSLEVHIKNILEYRQKAEECDHRIHEIDEEEKRNSDLDNLIVERGRAEEEVRQLEDQINALSTEISKYTIYLNQQKKKYDEETKKTAIGEKVEEQIDIMQQVKEYFEAELDRRSEEYSAKLRETIQELLDRMLTSARTVSVGKDFFLRVYDSFNDESKSEGQFAVVSFAYIGGIFKLLKEEAELASKEYPLVLDGPFSKLDIDQRQNVIDTIPAYAPQVILFSKDDLQAYFAPNQVGHIWTIESNVEKNVATVKEGFLWK